VGPRARGKKKTLPPPESLDQKKNGEGKIYQKGGGLTSYKGQEKKEKAGFRRREGEGFLLNSGEEKWLLPRSKKKRGVTKDH